MEPIAKIKGDMEFNKSLKSLVDVLKAIAVMEYQTLEKKTKTFERFLRTLEAFFTTIDLTGVSHQFLRPKVKNVGVIAVTSDAGLLGGLNMQILRTAIGEYSQHPGKLVVVGKKGHENMRGFNVPFVKFPGVKDDTRYEQSLQLRDYTFEQAMKGNIGSLRIVYPRAVSFVIQKVETVKILPFSDFLKGFGKSKTQMGDMILESSPANLLEYMVFLWLGQAIFEIFGWSRLAELGARYSHLEGSSQKVEDVNNKLRLKYFKVRHQLIDRSMCELFAAQSVYGNR